VIAVRIGRVTAASVRIIHDTIIEALRTNGMADMVIFRDIIIAVLRMNGTVIIIQRIIIAALPASTADTVINIVVLRTNMISYLFNRKAFDIVIANRTANMDSLLVVPNMFAVIAGTLIGNDAKSVSFSKKNYTRAFRLVSIIVAPLNRIISLQLSLRCRSHQWSIIIVVKNMWFNRDQFRNIQRQRRSTAVWLKERRSHTITPTRDNISRLRYRMDNISDQHHTINHYHQLQRLHQHQCQHQRRTIMDTVDTVDMVDSHTVVIVIIGTINCVLHSWRIIHAPVGLFLITIIINRKSNR